MRTFTTEHTVYTFSELSDEAKEKAIEEYRQGLDYPFLHDDMAEELERLLHKQGITYNELPKLYYSLSYCQGDGAMFKGTVYWKAWTADVNQAGNYYHYNSKNIDLTSTKTDEDAPADRYEKFDTIYVDICEKLAKFGYDIIEAESDEKNIADYLSDNDYEFYQDGSVAQ